MRAFVGVAHDPSLAASVYNFSFSRRLFETLRLVLFALLLQNAESGATPNMSRVVMEL